MGGPHVRLHQLHAHLMGDPVRESLRDQRRLLRRLLEEVHRVLLQPHIRGRRKSLRQHQIPSALRSGLIANKITSSFSFSSSTSDVFYIPVKLIQLLTTLTNLYASTLL